jgi:hypothetical protein
MIKLKNLLISFLRIKLLFQFMSKSLLAMLDALLAMDYYIQQMQKSLDYHVDTISTMIA